MITWTVVGTECRQSQGINFRNGRHKEIYAFRIYIELSNGYKRSGIGSAWSWGPSFEAEQAAERRAWGHLYHVVIPELREQFGKLRRV